MPTDPRVVALHKKYEGYGCRALIRAFHDAGGSAAQLSAYLQIPRACRFSLRSALLLFLSGSSAVLFLASPGQPPLPSSPPWDLLRSPEAEVSTTPQIGSAAKPRRLSNSDHYTFLDEEPSEGGYFLDDDKIPVGFKLFRNGIDNYSAMNKKIEDGIGDMVTKVQDTERNLKSGFYNAGKNLAKLIVGEKVKDGVKTAKTRDQIGSQTTILNINIKSEDDLEKLIAQVYKNQSKLQSIHLKSPDKENPIDWVPLKAFLESSTSSLKTLDLDSNLPLTETAVEYLMMFKGLTESKVSVKVSSEDSTTIKKTILALSWAVNRNPNLDLNFDPTTANKIIEATQELLNNYEESFEFNTAVDGIKLLSGKIFVPGKETADEIKKIGSSTTSLHITLKSKDDLAHLINRVFPNQPKLRSIQLTGPDEENSIDGDQLKAFLASSDVLKFPGGSNGLQTLDLDSKLPLDETAVEYLAKFAYLSESSKVSVKVSSEDPTNDKMILALSFVVKRNPKLTINFDPSIEKKKFQEATKKLLNKDEKSFKAIDGIKQLSKMIDTMEGLDALEDEIVMDEK